MTFDEMVKRLDAGEAEAELVQEMATELYNAMLGAANELIGTNGAYRAVNVIMLTLALLCSTVIGEFSEEELGGATKKMVVDQLAERLTMFLDAETQEGTNASEG